MLLDDWKAKQLIISIGETWNSSEGRCTLLQREDLNDSWSIFHSCTSHLGKKGMAWGKGLYDFSLPPYIFKEEGDQRSPAGVFTLGAFFGYEKINSTFPFVDLHEPTFAVDDSFSKEYNIIVQNPKKVTWQTAESMHAIKEYEYGIVVHHNFPHPIPFLGSAIFIHLEGDEKGTMGCTVFERNSLTALMRWLEFQKNPLFMQLPQEIYKKAAEIWRLPPL